MRILPLDYEDLLQLKQFSVLSCVNFLVLVLVLVVVE